jgi:hypothetical protein
MGRRRDRRGGGIGRARSGNRSRFHRRPRRGCCDLLHRRQARSRWTRGLGPLRSGLQSRATTERTDDLFTRRVRLAAVQVLRCGHTDCDGPTARSCRSARSSPATS